MVIFGVHTVSFTYAQIVPDYKLAMHLRDSYLPTERQWFSNSGKK
jgi:hypothetical protein